MGACLLLTWPHVYTRLHRMRCLRPASTAVAMLFLCAALLAAQSVQELQLVVTGDVPTPLTLHASDLASMPRE